jgi:hypothetical protein
MVTVWMSLTSKVRSMAAEMDALRCASVILLTTQPS